jgi:hypothetical protein
MKPSAPISIYIASSFRNLYAVQLLRDALRDRGHTVLDWTKLAPPLPEGMTPEKRRAALDSDERGEIFAACSEACGRADLVIYLGQAGQDAACEVGMAYVAGTPVFGLAGPLEKPGLILARAVTRWFGGYGELLEAVEGLAERAAVEPDRVRIPPLRCVPESKL